MYPGSVLVSPSALIVLTSICPCKILGNYKKNQRMTDVSKLFRMKEALAAGILCIVSVCGPSHI